MEIQQITGTFVEIFTDSVLGISYGKFFTFDTVISIKLPTQIDSYKYRHLLQANFLLEIEIVKTKKNWIIKNILNSKIIYEPASYNEYLLFAECIKLVRQNIREGQMTASLLSLIDYWSTCKGINLVDFDLILKKSLGFA
jgi:hypothetical protein